MNEFQLLTCSNLQPSDIVETICVSSSSWHCNTLYTCFFDWNCEHDKQKECHMKSKAGTEIIDKNCSTKFMKSLCSILSISLLQRKRNDETREQRCNQPTIKHDQQQRPHWFGHTYRMEENCLPKKKKHLWKTDQQTGSALEILRRNGIGTRLCQMWALSINFNRLV